MSRTLKGTAFVGLSLLALALTAGMAEAGTPVSSSGFQPLSSADAPFISRDFAFSGGALYNNAPATGASHTVTASQGVWTTPPSGSVGFTFYGNGNGKQVTCYLRGIGITSGAVYTAGNSTLSTSVTGVWNLVMSLDLTGVHEAVFVNAKCDIPPATSSGAFSVFWGVQ